MCTNAHDIGSGDLHSIETKRSDSRKNQWQRRRQNQDKNGPQNENLRSLTIKYRLDTLLAVFCLLLGHCICIAREDVSSSFPRPPPPPHGSSFSARMPTDSDDRGMDNGAQGYDDRNKQEEIRPPPPKYQDDFYNENSATKEGRGQSDSSSVEAQQQQNPIHYEFRRADGNRNLNLEEEKRYQSDNNRKVHDINDNVSLEKYEATSSARRDLITRYWTTKMGKAQIQTVVGLVGYGSGNFVAKSVFGSSDVVRWTGYFWALFLIISTWFRTPMGELSRAMGLSLILVLQRTQRIRREYPTWRYVAASVGILRGGPRDARGKPRGPRPFPPARNPWNYSPRFPRDPDFNMIYTVVSMALVGSTVGGNLPFIPNWIGALMGAASFAFACTWQNSHRGDLARTMGMRVVRAVTELWEIQADLQIIPKATVVCSQVIDKAMVLDRKHRVKDRFLSFANKGYAQASKVAEQIQMQQRGRDKNDRIDKEQSPNRRNYRSTNNYRNEEDDDRKKGVKDVDLRRSSRDFSRDAETDRSDEFSDVRSRSRRYDYDESDDNDRYYSGGVTDPNKARRSRQYEVETDDRFGKRTTSEYGEYDNGDGKEQFNEIESKKKSKGFFFRRK